MPMLDPAVDPAAQTVLALHLINDYQRDFPLCPAPFAELAAKLGVAEGVVLRVLEQLRREGEIARVGAVFAPKRIGSSTLVGMAVVPASLDAVAEMVGRFPEVNRCRKREHRYNLWFVCTAGSEGRLLAALGAIEQTAGCPMIRLPLLGEYRIGRDEENAVAEPMPEGATGSGAMARLDEIGRRLVVALQEGLPLFIRPFAVLAARLGCEEVDVLERIRRWSTEGVIKRFGVIVRHHRSENSVDALLVQDVPEEEAARLGVLLAREDGVSLCCRRSRALPEWPFNLFCMVSERDRAAVRERVAGLRRRLGLVARPYELIFSSESEDAPTVGQSV